MISKLPLIKYLVLALIAVFLGAFFTSLFLGEITAQLILETFNIYAQLVLTSWPAAILIIATALLFLQHEAIAYFIKNRMTGVGLDGVKGTVLESTATDIELKSKTIQEDKEVKRAIENNEKKEVSSILGGGTAPTIEDAPQTEATSSNEKVYDRLKKVAQIEEMVQTSLIERYGERYRPQVKLSIEGKASLIVDGLLYGKKGNKATAIEIKYISKKGTDALRFILARKVKRFAEFGIRHLSLVVVMDEIDESEAIKLQEQCINLAQIYFYKLSESGLEEIKIPSRNTSLF